MFLAALIMCFVFAALAVDLGRDVEQKRNELWEFIKAHKDAKTGEWNMTAEEVEQFNKRNDELGVKEKAWREAQSHEEIEASLQRNIEESAKRGPAPPFTQDPEGQKLANLPEKKSVGELFTEKKGHIKSGASGPAINIPDFDVRAMLERKTLFARTAGWAPQSVRIPGYVVLSAQEQPAVVDLIPKYNTGMAAVKYMEETTYTNNAAEVAEGGTYGEAALALTERSQTVEKVGVYIPVTDEQLEDVEGIREYINDRLTLMLDQKLDLELVVGDGSTPHLLGIINKASVLTQAKGADPIFDAVYKAMIQIRVTGKTEASGIAMHPNDFQDVRLARTVNGIYIYGSPMDPGPMRLFGLPIVLSTNVTENTVVVGDFLNHSRLYLRRGIEIQATNSHSDYFINGKQAIRADFRAAMVWDRSSAFCLVTGA